MKAYVLHAVNQLRYEDVQMPDCPAGWAIVQVKAAGICSSDIPRIFTKGTYHFPTIPGHEFAGIVCSVGSSGDADLVGRHVGVFPLIPCRECQQCQRGRYEMCEHYDYLGSRRDGGFAEYVAVPVWNLVVMDDEVPFAHAALLEPLSVALHAMKIAGVSLGDSVGIVGTGMIGICAAQWAKILGAKMVTVVGRNEEKRSLVESCGLNYVNGGVVGCGGSFDVVVEAVGTSATIQQAISLTAPSGSLVLMGNPASDIVLAQDVYWRILRKQLRIAGTWNSSFDGRRKSDWTEVMDALVQGRLIVDPLITHLYPQNQMQAGLEMMLRHQEPYCKVMTVWNNQL